MRVALRRTGAALTAAAILAGCSTASKDISATYVAPAQYDGYDCTQLNAEMTRLQSRYVELGGRLDQAAANDKAIVGVGVILFWPALFALGGTKQQEAEYGRLRGEHDAVMQTRVQKKCAPEPTLAPAPAVATVAAADTAASAPLPSTAASAVQ